MNANERIAFERLGRACELIRSAYRVHPLDVPEVVSRVKSAISAGAEDLAEDISEQVNGL